MKYKIEIWRYHSKIDEFTSENKNEVEDWFEEKYKALEEWGECTHYKYVDDEEVSELQKTQRLHMLSAKANEPFTNEEKDFIINALIESIYNYQTECPYVYDCGQVVGAKIGPDAIVDCHLKLYSDSLAFKKLIEKYHERFEKGK